MLATALLFAQQQGDGNSWGFLLPILLIIVLGYFMLLRPLQRQEKERQNILKATEKNDKIITNAGIYGTVVWVSDTEDEMEVRIADNVRIKMLKSCVHRNITKEEAFAAQKAAGTQKAADNAPSASSSTAIKK